MKEHNLDERKKTVFIFGGSQGSAFLNESMEIITAGATLVSSGVGMTSALTVATLQPLASQTFYRLYLGALGPSLPPGAGGNAFGISRRLGCYVVLFSVS